MITLIDTQIGAEDYAVTGSATLDGARCSWSLRWLGRVGRWHMALTDASGSPIMPWQIVQPAAIVLADRRRSDVPPGTLVWTGPDAYGRLDLGRALRLAYVSA
jgi:hypothetical protein